MSFNLLSLIPTDPYFVPTEDSFQAARKHFGEYLPDSNGLFCAVLERVEFFDAGEFSDGSHCCLCGKELDLEWWQKAMESAYETGFTDLAVETPCCNNCISLNDLECDVGFARFVLQATDPNIELKEEQIKTLEQDLNCRLRVIWARY